MYQFWFNQEIGVAQSDVDNTCIVGRVLYITGGDVKEESEDWCLCSLVVGQ